MKLVNDSRSYKKTGSERWRICIVTWEDRSKKKKLRQDMFENYNIWKQNERVKPWTENTKNLKKVTEENDKNSKH